MVARWDVGRLGQVFSILSTVVDFRTSPRPPSPASSLCCYAGYPRSFPSSCVFLVRSISLAPLSEKWKTEECDWNMDGIGCRGT